MSRAVNGAMNGDLAALLPGHVGHQRWYGGSPDDTITLIEAKMLEQPWPGLLRVVFESPARDRYQTLLGLREIGSPVDAPIGVLSLPEGEAVLVDATLDPDLDLLLLKHVDPSVEVATARPMGTEQSNTSIVFDERLILKLFRRLTGANPEVEVTRALARAGFDHVAAPLAVWHEDGNDLAILQPFLAGGIEGWALALTSLRSLLGEGVDPAVAGADFAPEAGRLGVVTAEMHLALGDAFGSAPGDPAAWADAMRARLGSVHPSGLDLDAVAASLERMRDVPDAGLSIRIHGDFHLGQVLRTDEGWFVLDFEGEPTRPVEERRRPSSPLRDVAGMMRSLSYASAVALREHNRPDDEAADAEAADLVARWERRNRDAFVSAYIARASGTPLLPGSEKSTAAILRGFELDKALYEVAYETAHRPDWVEIPLAAVRQLVEHP